MPIENLEDEGLPKNPNLELAQWKFLLSTDKYRNDEGLRKKLTDAVKGDNMAPFYEEVCHSLNWKADEHLLSKMKEANSAELKKLDEAIEDAEKNLGETEVREFMLKKAEYLSTIGDKEGALSQFRKTFEKTVTLGYRLDLVFHLIRIGLFYMDHDLVTRYLEKAQALIDEGGDWDRRNRLKVYRGVYCMSIRDFKNAANLFLDTVATFTSYELMDYYTFVTYTVFCCMIALERPQLREKLVAWVSCHSEVPGLVCSIGNAFYRTTEEYAAAAAQGQEDSIEMMFVCKNKVIKGSEILEVLHSLSTVKEFLFSLYDCHYGEFFKCLAQVEDIMKYDRLLAPHYRYFVREMRIVAYSQLLESYRSLTLNYMADSFQVTMEFIDQELSRFIAAGRLHCRIDKVGGIVETNRPDSKNWQYQATIKQGDILLNRIQKLSRVINI